MKQQNNVDLQTEIIKLRQDLYHGLINLQTIQKIESEKPYELGYTTGSIDALITVIDRLNRILEI